MRRRETSALRTLLELSLVALGALAGCSAATPRPATAPGTTPIGVVARDVLQISFPADLEVAPDGRRAILERMVADVATDGYRGELLEIALPSGTLRALGTRQESARHPRFSADGSALAYLVDGDEATELRVVATGGRRSRAIFAAPEGIESFAWSPDGKSFVVVRPDPEPAERHAAALAAAPIRITRTLAQRDGEGLLEQRRSHLWRIARSDGEATPITSGPFDDSSPAFSPDGQWIVFVSNRHPDPDATDDTDLYLVRPDGSELRHLPSGPGPDSNPSWSERGDRIAYLSIRRANDYYQPTRIATLTLDGAAPVDLTGALDAWVASDSLAAGGGAATPIWTDDDATILAPIERRGATWIAAIPTAGGGAPRELAGGAAVHGLVRPLPGGGLLYSRSDPTHPAELWLAAPGTEPRRLTSVHDQWLASRRLVTPEKVVARNADGDAVESWLYPPLEREPGRRYPLVLYIHGGPQGFDGDYFDGDLENQLFPAQGWGVLRVNYRGSTSYGEAFSRALWGDWHRREHEDLMAALDAAIAGHDWIDPQRLGIGGWSYGGILTLWAVGHTDRFAVGVPERFSFDYLSAFGEDQWFAWYLSELGSPLENEARYRELSPGTYLEKTKTPLYLIANEQDRNCPLPQVLQAYQRLKLMGQQTELVVYPGEPHTLTRPSHLIDRLNRLVDWYGRHLKE